MEQRTAHAWEHAQTHRKLVETFADFDTLPLHGAEFVVYGDGAARRYSVDRIGDIVEVRICVTAATTAAPPPQPP